MALEVVNGKSIVVIRDESGQGLSCLSPLEKEASALGLMLTSIVDEKSGALSVLLGKCAQFDGEQAFLSTPKEDSSEEDGLWQKICCALLDDGCELKKESRGLFVSSVSV